MEVKWTSKWCVFCVYSTKTTNESVAHYSPRSPHWV